MVYSPGRGPVPFTYSAEAYPLYIRSYGMSLATATTWFFNMILSITWPASSRGSQPAGRLQLVCWWLLAEQPLLTCPSLRSGKMRQWAYCGFQLQPLLMSFPLMDWACACWLSCLLRQWTSCFGCSGSVVDTLHLERVANLDICVMHLFHLLRARCQLFVRSINSITKLKAAR